MRHPAMLDLLHETLFTLSAPDSTTRCARYCARYLPKWPLKTWKPPFHRHLPKKMNKRNANADEMGVFRVMYMHVCAPDSSVFGLKTAYVGT